MPSREHILIENGDDSYRVVIGDAVWFKLFTAAAMAGLMAKSGRFSPNYHKLAEKAARSLMASMQDGEPS